LASRQRKRERARVPSSLMLVSCLAYFSTLKIEATCSSKTSINFSALRGVIFEKMKLFITSAARTSHPTNDRVIR
jgi:hypothetical protein